MRTLGFIICLAIALTNPASRQCSAINPPPKEAFEKFKSLQEKYKAQSEQYWKESEAAGDDSDKQQELYQSKYPGNTLAQEFLDLEKQYRGTQVGLSCLYHLIAGQMGDVMTDLPGARGKQQAISLLCENYVDHPDLDEALKFINYGPYFGEETERLLERATQSPHRHVRGNALYQLAVLMKDRATVPPWCESMRNIMKEADADDWQYELVKLAEVRAPTFDVASSRKRALKLFKTVLNDYADVLTPPNTGRTPVLIDVDRNSADELRITLGQLATRMQFELQHLTTGRQAPDIDQPDAFGKPLRLSDHRGKVVVLMFSAKGCVPCEQAYPAIRKLIKAMKDRPFAFVGVMGHEKTETVREAVESGKITWPVWRAGPDRELFDKWNITTIPTFYVIDQSGIVRFPDLRHKFLDRAVHKLVEQAEAAE